MRRIVALVVVAVMLWAGYRRTQTPATVTNTPFSGATNARSAPAPRTDGNPNAVAGGVQASPPSSERSSANHSDRGFQNRARLDEHFAKHGSEFAGLDEAQYLAMAQTLRDAPAGGDILEIVRPGDAVVSRFDKRSGAFLAFDGDGTIRTFFKPNDGEKYFRRQANRTPGR